MDPEEESFDAIFSCSWKELYTRVENCNEFKKEHPEYDILSNACQDNVIGLIKIDGNHIIDVVDSLTLETDFDLLKGCKEFYTSSSGYETYMGYELRRPNFA